MVKKLNELAAQGGESNLTATIRDSATNIWLARARRVCQGPGGRRKAFRSPCEGRRGRGDNCASKSAQETITDARTKATGTWDKLEQVFVDRVSRALTSLNVPTKHDIDALAKRVEELTKATTKLSHALEDGGAKKAEAPAKKAAARAHN